jgi:thiol:disulfide interchange protein DsbD
MKRWIINFVNLAVVSLVLGSLSFVSANAQAATDRAVTEQVSAQLLASANAASPGETLWLGVQQKIIPHWHTYWINPGDSGIPTRIDWHLPAGISASAIQWPLPSRFALGPIINYGYADEVTLLTSVAIPAYISVGETLPLSATVSWLVCEEICIPQKVELALTLPVVAPGQTKTINPLIDAARAQLPQPSAWPLRLEPRANGFTLRVVGAAAQLQSATEITFFADEWGRVEHGAEQTHRVDGNDVLIELTAGEKALAPGDALSGVLVVGERSDKGTVRSGFSVRSVFSAPGAGTSLTNTSVEVPITTATDLSLLPAALLAFLGGVILNLMPCVFPVLSIKALSLLKHNNYTARQTRLQGVVYTGGVLASFAGLALLLIVLKAGGTQIGWGFQYQSPLFVVLVAYLLFAVGLSLSGVFTLGASVAGVGSTLAERPGYTGSFFTGVLAAIVATPCTAPFMGAAIGYALAKPPLQLLAVFVSLGLGLALPYLLLTWWPLLRRHMPKPGAWMEWLKQALAFPMYAAAVWLVWVLAQQAGPNAIAFALAGIVIIAFAAWIFQNTRSGNAGTRHIGSGIAVAALVLAVVSGYTGVANSTSAQVIAATGDKNWEAYSQQRLQNLRAQGKPVFVNFTAAWCISCLVNDRVALQQASVVGAFREQGIAYLKGDWTNQDREISAKLAEFGRSGVPLYLFFPAGVNTEPLVLPQILTPDIVLSAITSSSTVATAVIP